MVVCVECLPADKPWDVVSVTRRSSGVAPRACVHVACVRVYARVLVPLNLYPYPYIHTYIIVILNLNHCHCIAHIHSPTINHAKKHAQQKKTSHCGRDLLTTGVTLRK